MAHTVARRRGLGSAAAADQRGHAQANRGVNTVVLWVTAQAEGCRSAVWAIYRQWAELGAQVRKGERASPVVFWKISDQEEQEDTDEGAEDGRRSRFGWDVRDGALLLDLATDRIRVVGAIGHDQGAWRQSHEERCGCSAVRRLAVREQEAEWLPKAVTQGVEFGRAATSRASDRLRLGPLSPGRTAVGFHVRAVEEHLDGRSSGDRQGFEDVLPDAPHRPAHEPILKCLARSVGRRRSRA